MSSVVGWEPRQSNSHISLTMCCCESLIARDAHSERLGRLVGKKKLFVGAGPTHHSTTLAAVMLRKKLVDQPVLQYILKIQLTRLLMGVNLVLRQCMHV